MSLVKKLAVQTAPDVTTTYDIGADAQNVDYGAGNVKTKLDSVVNKSTIAPVETSTTASASYAIGDYFILNDDFCTVTAAISAGDTLIEDTNYTVAPLVDSLENKFANYQKDTHFDQTATLLTSATTTVTFSDSAITTTSLIDIAVSEWGLIPTDVTVASGTCTVTMPKVDTARSVTVRIYVR